MTGLRERLAERLGEETTTRDPVLDELQLRLQRIAPEARAGDGEALAKAATLEAEIVTHERHKELAALAAIELAQRERDAAEADAARRRDEAGRALAEAQAARDREVMKVDRLLRRLGASLAAIRDLDGTVSMLGPQHRPGTDGYAYPGALALVQSVVDWERDVSVPRTRAPRPSLHVSECKVCLHEARAEIDEALAADESQRSVAERFGVARTTLARHHDHN